MSMLAAWTATFEAFAKVFAWKTGGRSLEQNTSVSKTEEAEREFVAAMESDDVDRVNRAYCELIRLREQTVAKRI